MTRSLGYAGPCLMLAFDHRDLLAEMCRESAVDVPTVKQAIFEGARLVADRRPADLAARRLGIFVDEHYGATIARAAKREGFLVAMPVERSGAPEYEPAYGDAFGDHIEAFDPDFNKVLVRFNPEGPADVGERQLTRLRALSDWLHARDRLLLFELLVPATEDQLARAGGRDAYLRELRPHLTLQAMREIRAAGVEPDLWKLEPAEDPADYRAYVDAAREGGRDDVACVLLGGGGSADRIAATAAEALRGGFAGFTIGRTIWDDPVRGLIAGRWDAGETAERVARNYMAFIDVHATTGAIR